MEDLTWPEKLRQVRLARHLSLEEVAERIRYSESFIKRIESGIVPRPSVEIMSRLTDLYHITIEELGYARYNPIINSDGRTPNRLLASEINQPVTINPIPLFPKDPFYQNKKSCFVIMPFTTNLSLQEVYDDGIKPAIQDLGLICGRADDIYNPGTIIRQIWRSLMEAAIVISDLTTTNANVLYELGLAHVIGHEAILLTQSMDYVPFDLRQQRHIVYSSNGRRIAQLREKLKKSIQECLSFT